MKKNYEIPAMKMLFVLVNILLVIIYGRFDGV